MSLKNIGSIINGLSKLEDFDNIFDAMDEVPDLLDSVADKLKKVKSPEKLLDGFDFSDDLLDHAGLTKTADTIDDVGDAMTTASGGVSSLQLAFSGLVNTVKPFLPMLAKVAVGVAAVAAVAYVIDEAVLTAEEANEEFTNSFEAYNNTVTNIDRLNDELEATGKRIEELESKDSLTLVETEELNKLKQQNSLLDRQIKNQKILKETQQKALASNASTALNTKIIEYGVDGSYNPITYKNKVEKTEVDVKRLAELQEEYNSLLIEQSNLDPNEDSPLFGKNEYEKVSERLDSIREQIEENSVGVSDTITEITEQYSALFDESGNLINEQDAEMAESIERLLTLYSEGEEAVKVFDVFHAKGVEKTQEEFAELAEQGELTVDIIKDEFPKIAEAAQSQNIPLQTLIDYFVLLADEANNATESASSGLYDVLDAINETGSAFNKAKSAMDSANKGSAYDSMREMAEKAKELQKSGDVGTDDFKSIATMFSSSGADDSTNFSENLKKINRYFTEDNSGLLNFLNDLKDKGFAELNKETQEWSYSIDDLEEAARKMGMGFEPFMAMFGKLEDKGFYNDFFTTQEEGTSLLTKLTNDLYEAERELWDLENNDSGNTTAIEKKKKEIEKLKSRIDTTSDSLDKLLNKSPEERLEETKKNRKTIQSSIDAYNKNKDKFSQTEEGQSTLETWRNEIISGAESTNFEIVVDVDGKLKIKNVDEATKQAEEESNKKPARIKGNVDLTNRPLVDGSTMRNAGWTDIGDNETATVYSSSYSNKSGDKTIVVTPILPNGKVLSPSELDDYANEVLKSGIDSDNLVISTFNGKNSIDEAEKYAEMLHRVQEAYYLGNDAQMQYLDAIRYVSKEELQAIDLNDKKSSSLEKAFRSLMDSFGVTEEQANQFINVLSDMDIIQIDTSQAIDSLTDLQDYLNNEDYTKIVELVGEDNASGMVNVWNALQADDKFTSLNGQDKASYLIELWETFTPEQKEVVLKGGDEAQKVIQEVNQETIEDKNPTITVDNSNALSGIDKVNDELDKLDNKKVHTYTYNHQKTVNDNFTGANILSGNRVDGTFHAHAQGTNVAIREHQTALVNEVGNEGLVRNGVLQEIEGGAQLIKLKPGDIIFNHKQMEELKKRGYITSGGGRGKLVGGGAFANGTINAFSGEKSGGNGGGTLDYSPSSTKTKSSTNKDKADKTSKKANTALEKFQKKLSKLFDWVEVKLDRLSRKTDNYQKKAENATTLSGRENNYLKAANNTVNEITYNQKGATKYRKQANKVADQAVSAGLVSKKQMNTIKKRVANGTIDISSYNEKTQEVIKAYQEWYEKSIDCKDAVIDLKQQSKELMEEWANSAIEKGAEKVEKLGEEVDLLNAKLENTDGYEAQNKQLDNIIKKEKAIRDQYNTTLNNTNKNLETAKSGVQKYIKGEPKNIAKVKSGQALSTSGLKGKELKSVLKYNAALEAQKTAAYDADLAQEEYTSTLRENRMQQLENIKAEYDSKDAILDASNSRLQAMNDLKESRGEYLSASDYEGLLGNASANILNQEEELKEYVERFNQNRADMSAEDIADATAYIDEMKAGIEEAKQEQQELNNAVANLPYEKYERQLELLDAIAEKRKSEVDLAEAQGKDLLESDYTDQINNNLTEIKLLEAERNQAYNDYMNAMRNGGVYGGKSAEEWQKEYLGLDAEINGVKADNEALKDSLRDDVYWRDFERAHKACEDLQSVLEGMDGLIDEAMMFDDDGGFTELGVSHIANLVKQYENARDEVQNYTDDIENLDKLYKEGQYTEQEYKEKLVELQGGLFDSADAMKSYINSVKELYKQQEQAELDNLFEIIDARNEALQKKKEYYDYDKNLQNQTKELQILEAERAALEGINTAEAKAKKAQLDAEIAEQKEALDETVEQHLMDISTEALDSLKETMQDAFDDRWASMDSNMQAMVGLMQTANELSTQNAADVKNAMFELLKYYGIDASKTGLTSVTGYAGGTKKVPRDMIAMINESGAEMVVTKHGLLTPLSRGDGVIPADMTENLMRMATTGNIGTPEIVTPQIQMPNVESGNVLIVEGNLLNIEGHTTAVTKDDLNDYSKKLENTLVEKSYKYTSNKMYSGYLKTGGKRRI